MVSDPINAESFGLMAQTQTGQQCRVFVVAATAERLRRRLCDGMQICREAGPDEACGNRPRRIVQEPRLHKNREAVSVVACLLVFKKIAPILAL